MHDVGIFAKTTKSDVSYGVQTPSTKENRKKRNNMHQIVLNMPKENIQKNSDFFLFLFMCLCMWFACLCVLHLWRHIQSWIRNIPPLFFHFILEVWSLNQIQSMLVKATLSGNLLPGWSLSTENTGGHHVHQPCSWALRFQSSPVPLCIWQAF